jgi:serine protease Do
MKSVWMVLLALSMASCAKSEERYEGMVHKALPTVVRIDVDDVSISSSGEKEHQDWLGSGVFISEKGHVLTCAHLFSTGTFLVTVTPYWNQTVQLKAEIVFVDHYKDLALIRLIEYRERTPYARLAKRVNVGQEVVAIGCPRGFNWSVSAGVVSGFNLYQLILGQSLQTDAAINPGNSGGPLFNRKGEVVGINNMMVSPVHAFTGLGFAVSVSELKRFLYRFKGLQDAY